MQLVKQLKALPLSQDLSRPWKQIQRLLHGIFRFSESEVALGVCIFHEFPTSLPPDSRKVEKKFFFFFFVYLFVQVELTYNIVLISAVQRSDSVIHIYILFIFFSIMVYHKMLNMVPCAVGQDMLFSHSGHNSLHLLVPNSQPNLPFCWQSLSLFSRSVSLFLFCRQVHLCLILDPTYK